MLGLDFVGEAFEERFLIAGRADVWRPSPRALVLVSTHRFHAGRSALLHKAARRGSGASTSGSAGTPTPHEEQKPENVIPRIRQMLGHSDFRARMGLGLHLPVPKAGALRCTGGWSSPAMRRTRSPPSARRGANSGIPGRREPRLEARPRDPGPRARLADRHVRRRARRGGGRETSGIPPARPTSSPRARPRFLRCAFPRRGARARTAYRVRQADHGEVNFRPALDAQRLPRQPALDPPTPSPGGGSARLGAPVPDAPMATPTGEPVWLLDALGGDAVEIRGPPTGRRPRRHRRVCGAS